MIINKYLDELNKSQREAVENTDGALLVLAGAGTGKTKVLTSKIAHIISLGKANPSNILAVTFTNKAAREMKHRIGQSLGSMVEGMPWLGTFHSIGAKILRIHPELVGLKSDFTILDTDDQLRLIKQIIKLENIDDKRWAPKLLLSYINTFKNKGLMPTEIEYNQDFQFADRKASDLYALYQNRLSILNSADFGDLLLLSLNLLKNNADILDRYQNIFSYILVDEYQDTNVAQYLWLRLLSQKNYNIACVGDDDQSIYGWRGAEVDNILRFESDYPGAKIIRLEENYRSTQKILGAASGIISYNKDRLGKTLIANIRDDGEDVHIRSVWDAENEARLVTDEIESKQRKGAGLEDIAILVRASFQMREFEDRFIISGIPYRVIGGPRFYERQEIKDAISYIQVVSNPNNDLKLERIINIPKRGIGNSTLQTLNKIARSNNISLFLAAKQIIETDEIRGQTKIKLTNFVNSIELWKNEKSIIHHTDLVKKILDESGYTEMWQNDKSPTASGRLENLKELIGQIDEFDSLDGFLEHVSLVMELESDSATEKVSIMTLHAAKGLEFDNIFLPGWEDGLFPNQRSLDEKGNNGLEEERRLAHVGITRAKRSLWITYALHRRVYGLWQQSIPSRFIDEIPEKYKDFDAEYINTNNYYQQEHQSKYIDFNEGHSNTKDFYQQEVRTSMETAKRKIPAWKRIRKNHEITINADFQEIDIKSKTNFILGQRVFHEKFGYGKIIDINQLKLEIDFEKSGIKTVLESYVKIH
ncbi:UvrD-helicase domain-containing protein [Hyphomicrobiales bacterium]|nr:UvrD-helicase domain-containing protein [Hyphomicrobiales bacterium]